MTFIQAVSLFKSLASVEVNFLLTHEKHEREKICCHDTSIEDYVESLKSKNTRRRSEM